MTAICKQTNMGWLPTRRVPCQLLHLPLRGEMTEVWHCAVRACQLPIHGDAHGLEVFLAGRVRLQAPAPGMGSGLRAANELARPGLPYQHPFRILAVFVNAAGFHAPKGAGLEQAREKSGTHRSACFAGFCSKFIQQSAPDWATRVALSDSRYISSHFPFAPEQ